MGEHGIVVVMAFGTVKTRRFVGLRGLAIALAIAPLPAAWLYNRFAQDHLSQCPFQARFGFPSPSCGLTRSILALLRGDWVQAFSYHAFGPLMVAIAALVVLHSSLELYYQRPLGAFYTRLSFQITVLVGGLFLSIAYYGLRLYLRYFTADLPSWIVDHTLGQWLIWGARSL
ncbi:MAG: DUF2752 domain-containing protein [Spirulina sp. DLM2.Bin59]|nr:MAG: DUF2752 domain-containing protein [Spirulina sp. DLM2.Bin59]